MSLDTATCQRPPASPSTGLAAGVLVALALCFAASAAFAIPSRNLELLGAFNQFPPTAGASLGSGYASCWHYVHGDGREYAIIGCQRGVAIYNVTIPTAAYLVDSIPGPTNLWREMKSYRNWIYVVTEANSANPPGRLPGLQIIRMTDPEHPVLVATYTTNFLSSHTVSVDTSRALLFCNGTRNGLGQPTGVRILSLANPEAPVEVGSWPGGVNVPTAQYVHDCVPIGNRLFAASIYAGTERIIDITNPAAPAQVAAWTYPRAYYAHNSWPDSSGNYLYVTDEQNGQTLRVFDIHTYSALETMKNPVSEWTSNPQAIVHNAHVRGHELWLANYTEGVRALDISDPAHPAEFGWADTYGGSSGGFKGVWGVDPFLPSGTVIASDMQSGLYLFRAVRDYGLVRVAVIDAATLAPVDSALVRVTTQGDSSQTRADGIVAFAPSPGTHTIQVSKFGYQTVTLTPDVVAGSNQTLAVALVRKPTADLMGTVRDAVSQEMLPEAEVNLRWTPVHEHTDAGSVYHLHDVPNDFYRVDVRRPGYIPVSFERNIGPGFDGTQDFQLVPAAAWDNLSSDAGWTVTGPATSSAGGRWTRVEPYGTSTDSLSTPPAPGLATDATCNGAPFAWARDLEPLGIKPAPGMFHEGRESDGATPGQVQPQYDRSPAPDSMCFVTGNLTGIPLTAIDAADVDSTTILTSPAYDLTGKAIPTFGVWLWFYSQFRSPDDYLALSISGDDGATWVPVDTLRGIHNHWEEHAIPVANYVTPSTKTRLRFVAVDGGEPSIVEAAVDDITAYDGAIAPVGVIQGSDPVRLGFRVVWPNPARDRVNLVLALPAPGSIAVDVFDVTGRHVRALHRGRAAAGTLTLWWDGADDAGHGVSAGLYFARARTPFGTTQVRFTRMQ